MELCILRVNGEVGLKMFKRLRTRVTCLAVQKMYRLVLMRLSGGVQRLDVGVVSLRVRVARFGKARSAFLPYAPSCCAVWPPQSSTSQALTLY